MVIKTVSKLSYINITCINLRRHSSDPFIGTAGVKRDKTAIHGGQYSFWCTASFYLIIFGG